MMTLGVLTMSNKLGRATVSGVGSTGAPGDDPTVCQSCHNGPTTVAVEILVLDQGDTIKEYEPNKTYQIHVRVKHVSGNIPKAHGFQMTLLNAAKNKTGPNLKNLLALSSNVKLVTPRNGRLYAEQADRSTANLFEIQWTAPNVGSGPVTIYAGGTGVNANDSDSGDGGSKSAFEINEKLPSSTQNENSPSISIYPNPFAEKFWIQGTTDNLKEIDIVDLFGKKMNTLDFEGTDKSVDLSYLNDGIYFAKFIDHQNNIIKTQKLMKRSQRP
jgi:hypothetical protein